MPESVRCSRSRATVFSTSRTRSSSTGNTRAAGFWDLVLHRAKERAQVRMERDVPGGVLGLRPLVLRSLHVARARHLDHGPLRFEPNVSDRRAHTAQRDGDPCTWRRRRGGGGRAGQRRTPRARVLRRGRALAVRARPLPSLPARRRLDAHGGIARAGPTRRSP